MDAHAADSPLTNANAKLQLQRQRRLQLRFRLQASIQGTLRTSDWPRLESEPSDRRNRPGRRPRCRRQRGSCILFQEAEGRRARFASERAQVADLAPTRVGTSLLEGQDPNRCPFVQRRGSRRKPLRLENPLAWNERRQAMEAASSVSLRAGIIPLGFRRNLQRQGPGSGSEPSGSLARQAGNGRQRGGPHPRRGGKLAVRWQVGSPG